ncbi:MAG: hypothetical protein ACK50E_04245 [Bacteroidota bacterium]|jgi:hypothetical protein
MVFFLDPKQFHQAKLFYPKSFLADMIPQQSLNIPDIAENPRQPDPAMIDSFEKKTTIKDLGEQVETDELSGSGFRVNGGKISKNKNDKLRKFISLKL